MNTASESFLIFQNVRQVIRADNLLCSLQIKHSIVPVPRGQKTTCKVCIEIEEEDQDDLVTLFKEEGFICSLSQQDKNEYLKHLA